MPIRGDWGQQRFAPSDASEVRATYELAGGQLAIDLSRVGTTGPWPGTRLFIQPGGTNPVTFVQIGEHVSNALLVSDVNASLHDNLVLTFRYQQSRQVVVEVVAADGTAATMTVPAGGDKMPNPLPTSFSYFDKDGQLFIFGVPQNGQGGYQDVYVITRVTMVGARLPMAATIASTTMSETSGQKVRASCIRRVPWPRGCGTAPAAAPAARR